MTVDLNSATGSLLMTVLAFELFSTKEEGFLLKTSTEGRCFFSPVITYGLVMRHLAWLSRRFTIPHFTN